MFSALKKALSFRLWWLICVFRGHRTVLWFRWNGEEVVRAPRCLRCSVFLPGGWQKPWENPHVPGLVKGGLSQHGLSS